MFGSVPKEGKSFSCAVAAHSQAMHHSSELHAPEVEYKPPPEARKKGAIIGSAPKLNPEGILTAAREAKAREEAQKRKVSSTFPPHGTSSLSSLVLKLPRAPCSCSSTSMMPI